MSDFFIKTGSQGSTGWRKMSNLFVKTSSQGNTGWRAAAGIWLRTSLQWLKVWPLSGVFATRTAWIGPDSTTTYADRLTSSSVIRIGSNYYGNNAQWDANGWTISSYSYAWKYYLYNSGEQTGTTFPGESGTGSGWTSGGTGQDVLPLATWDNATNNTTYDRKYLRFEVTANATNSTYSGFSTSPYIQIIRRIPINLTTTLSSYTPAIGTQLTYSSTWDSSEARKAESARTTIQWYKNSISSTTGGTLIGTGSSYTPTTNNTTYGTGSDVGFYIYVVETRYNSGTDYDLGLSTGVEATAITTSAVSQSPNAFTYTLTNASTVTTPSTPSQQRVSSTSNIVLFEVGSLFPSDTYRYGINQSGSAAQFPGSPAQYVDQLNGWNSNGDFVGYGSGSFDALSSISSSASNSPFTISTTAYGVRRRLQANVSTTDGAQSWAINFSWSGATASGVTYYNYGSGTLSGSTSATVTVNTNFMPYTICEITGNDNPTVTINSITAYSSTNLGGANRAGTAGSPTSLSSIARPTATSGSNTANYTYYVNYQATGNQRRVNLPSNFTSGSTVYVSTNGYIGINTDPSGSVFPTSSGLYLMPLQGDQRQTALWTYSDASNFYVRWQGARYNDSAQTIDYQAKFYWNSTAVDVYFVTNNLSSSNPASTTAVYNNGVATVDWSGSTSQSSTLLSTGSMTRNTSQDGVDDNRTAITASIPVSPPVNITTPSVTPTSAAAGSTFSCSTGGWTNSPTSYSYQWQYFEGGAFGWVNISGQTSSTFNSTGYGGLSIRCIVTATNSGGSTQATSNQATVTVPVSIPSGGSVTLSGNNTVGSVITASTSGWSGSPTSYDVFITTALSPNVPTSSSSRVATNSPNTSTSVSYTITSSDAISPVNVFRAFATATNTAGTSSPPVQSSNTITTQATPTGTAPSTPTNGGGTYSSGTNYVTNATFTRSTSGTTPITYYWRVYAGTSNGFTGGTFWNSGSFSSSTLGGTATIPQQSWNQSTYGNWARYEVYASNNINTSGTLTWWI